MTYSEKLRDPRWQKRRLEIMQRDSFRCRNCTDDTTTLNVDHRIYRKRLEPWEYVDADLWTLCEVCHKEIGEKRQKLFELIGCLDGYELNRAAQLLNYIPLMDEVLIITANYTVRVPIRSWDCAINYLKKNEFNAQSELEHFNNALD